MADLPNNSTTGPLAPKFNINQDTRDPNNKPPRPPRSWTGYVPMGVFFLFALVAIPLTMRELSQRQDVRQRASGPLPTQVIPTSTPFPSPTDEPTATPSTTLTPTKSIKQSVSTSPTIQSEN